VNGQPTAARPTAAVTTPRRTVLHTLRQIRVGRGWTLGQLASATGINKGTLSQIERGRLVASQHELRLIAAALELDMLENRTVPCHETTAA